MNDQVSSLFQLTRSQITEEHIVEFSPMDPGYSSYVQLWTQIFRTGVIPSESEFDLSEVIGLTSWSNPADFENPIRFREYRRFASSVAAALVYYGNDSDSVRPGNYLARDLLVDIDSPNTDHFKLVRSVFPTLRNSLFKMECEPEYPYFTLGSLIIAQMAGDYEQSVLLASSLIADEAAVRNDDSLTWLVENSRFLFGLTNYDQLHNDWSSFVANLTNPSKDENLELVLEALAKDAT